jgi:6-phosphogluconate dehydrogenase (decarboxylating)
MGGNMVRRWTEAGQQCFVGRFESRGNAGYPDRPLSAMRKQFGGHDEKK